MTADLDHPSLVRRIYEVAASAEGSPDNRPVLSLPGGAFIGVEEVAALVVEGLLRQPPDQLQALEQSMPGEVERIASEMAPAVMEGAAVANAALPLHEAQRVAGLAIYAIHERSERSFMNTTWFGVGAVMFGDDEMVRDIRGYSDSELVEAARRIAASQAAIESMHGSRLEYWMAAGMRLLLHFRGHDEPLTDFMFETPELGSEVVVEPANDLAVDPLRDETVRDCAGQIHVPTGPREGALTEPATADLKTIPAAGTCRSGHALRSGSRFCHLCGASVDGSRRSRQGALSLGLVIFFLLFLVGMPVGVGIHAAANVSTTTTDTIALAGPQVIDSSGTQEPLPLSASTIVTGIEGVDGVSTASCTPSALNVGTNMTCQVSRTDGSSLTLTIQLTPDPNGYQLYDVTMCTQSGNCVPNPFNFSNQ